jgi:regulation of enolase protein 1 (concanavalin A-like superfamily)/phosphatidylserine/phosphatidylglycerophosphate/cardiolipin synthase-like enzyme
MSALPSMCVLATLFGIVPTRDAAAETCSGTDCVLFTQFDSVSAALVQAIKAETVRIDMSAWYLDDANVIAALVNAYKAGVPIRLIGDRDSIFEIDQHTRSTFENLASMGVPIRLRYNPTWYPEIDHWKATMFVGQKLVEFGSPNYTFFELAPYSSTNYNDENALFTTDQTLFNAMESKFDTYWNDTTAEPESLVPSPPYFKNWNDACPLEPACADYYTNYPNPAPMVVNTNRLFGNFAPPADLIFGQGPDFNNRLTTEINNENTAVDLALYRLTVPNITQALLNRFQAGVRTRVIIEPNEYLNRKWPEFWITHANVDSLWAAGIPILQRLHDGNTHMKTLITSAYASVASSNFSAAWQRDDNYFVSASSKAAIYAAIESNFQWMWTNSNGGYATFVPQPADAPTLATPASGAAGVSTSTGLTWNIAVFATNYDVYLGTSQSSMSRVGNVQAQLVNNPPSTYSWTPGAPLACSTTYYWQVVSRTNATPRNSSLVSPSQVSSFTTGTTNCGSSGGGGALPSPWSSQDIGATGLSGSASYSSGTFTLSGAGSDIWGTADSFQFVSQPLSGDGTIIVRVSGEQNTSAYAKAGVMIRQSLTATSAHVILDVRPDGTVEFMTRTTDGGSTTFIGGSTQAFPAWLKLARTGSTIAAFISGNGSTWTAVGSTSTSMSVSTNVGLLVTSHNTSALNTSTFDNVSVSGGSGSGGGGLPSPWVNQDVGSTGVAGSASYSNGAFTVSGAGADIWGSADAFQFASQGLSGDGTIVARVTAEQNTSTYAKAGVMIRQSLSATSPHVILDVRPDGTVEFMTRTADGGSTTFISGSTQAFPAWLKLVRTGSTVAAFTSGDGSTWKAVGSTSTSMSASTNIGLAVTSHGTGVLNTSTFDNVSVSAGTSGGGGLPSPWLNQDIGSTGASGSSAYSNGTFTVSGAGADIWGSADAFQFAYQPLNGDGIIVARVVAEQNTSSYAKAGIMIRQSLTATSPHVILDVRPDGTVEFMTRTTDGGSTTFLNGSTQAFPAWLKLARSGATISAYTSADGSTWTTIGSTATSMSASTSAGLLVTSHTNGVTSTSSFDNVSVTAGSTPPPPSSSDIVIYASDVPSANLHGEWVAAADPTSPNGIKLSTPDNGVKNTTNALAAPVHYVDVPFTATGGTQYTLWLRLKALNNNKVSDSIYVQFSDAQISGAAAYPTGTTSGLIVNLATDSTGSSDMNWGWVDGAYWLGQTATVTFPSTGTHTLRIQVREDGVQVDQIVLSPSRYFNAAASCPTSCGGAPGPVSNDTTIVTKP